MDKKFRLPSKGHFFFLLSLFITECCGVEERNCHLFLVGLVTGTGGGSQRLVLRSCSSSGPRVPLQGDSAGLDGLSVRATVGVALWVIAFLPLHGAPGVSTDGITHEIPRRDLPFSCLFWYSFEEQVSVPLQLSASGFCQSQTGPAGRWGGGSFAFNSAVG